MTQEELRKKINHSLMTWNTESKVGRENILEEVINIINQHVKEVIGENEDVKSNGKKWLAPDYEIPLRNQLKEELRKRAELTK